MTNEFENALAWFCSAPAAWIESGKSNLAAAAAWVWEVLQGDFAENQSTAQIAAGTVISMIPVVDQLCDIRDFAANCTKIKNEPEEPSHRIALVFTLIGLFPTLGSLLKGGFKVAFASVRKGTAVSGISPPLVHMVDKWAAQLNNFLARPDVVKTLKALKIDNPRKYFAAELRKIADKLNSTALMRAFNDAQKAAEPMLNLVQKWGSEGLTKKAVGLLQTIAEVRTSVNRGIEETLQPAQNYLNCLARRLNIDADMAHRAYLDVENPHGFIKLSATEESAAFAKAKPGWVDNTNKFAYRPVRTAPYAPPGWTSTARDAKRGDHVLNDAHATFHTIKPITLPPGTVLYRIVDPTSKDNSICWMSKAEFDKLKTKPEWRRRFAVWAKWNSNGEFITYTVPPGPGLNVWEGITASQKMKGANYVLEGGARQIVVDPAHLQRSYLGPRKKTGWGYDDLGTTNDLVGVPVQTHYWYEKKGP